MGENKAIIVDSLNKKQNGEKKTEDDYFITDCVNLAWGGNHISWKVVQCNQQPGSWECGYYVLTWMFSMVTRQSVNIDELSWDERALSKREMDDIVERWHMFCPILSGIN
ncbi:uncharacterized protein [Rutidosis leptorrhynchoides]|uniref:uncharacterized protein n=1 Tax=Rutidosis leptorrhynchoides TaxID=125765 RepID=UPI003A990EF5